MTLQGAPHTQPPALLHHQTRRCEQALVRCFDRTSLSWVSVVCSGWLAHRFTVGLPLGSACQLLCSLHVRCFWRVVFKRTLITFDFLWYEVEESAQWSSFLASSALQEGKGNLSFSKKQKKNCRKWNSTFSDGLNNTHSVVHSSSSSQT